MCAHRHPARGALLLGLGALAYPLGLLLGGRLGARHGRRHLLHPG